MPRDILVPGWKIETIREMSARAGAEYDAEPANDYRFGFMHGINAVLIELEELYGTVSNLDEEGWGNG